MDLKHFISLVEFYICVLLCWVFTGFLHDFGIIHRDLKVRDGGKSELILLNGTKCKQMYYFLTNIIDNISPYLTSNKVGSYFRVVSNIWPI